ncbi:MAG: tryptophan-rich sensory protein [Saprospiraceae bacterium]|nr:tryptophan-rich sensory protein [Saprospiraceae bacterium]
MRNATIFTLFTIGVLVMNYLANSLPLNGVTTGEISDKYNSLITPAGVAFSIWGIIYLSLIGWLGRLWYGAFKKDERIIRDSDQLLVWYPLNCTLNAGWLAAWHYGDVNLSLLIMLGILITLIMIYLKTESFQVLWKFPFSIYMGWISVATIVNVSVMAIHNQWVLFPGEAVNTTLIMMVIATVLGLVFVHHKRDVIYALVIAWALFFIGVENTTFQSIQYTGYGLAVLILINIAYAKFIQLRTVTS